METGFQKIRKVCKNVNKAIKVGYEAAFKSQKLEQSLKEKGESIMQLIQSQKMI